MSSNIIIDFEEIARWEKINNICKLCTDADALLLKIQFDTLDQIRDITHPDRFLTEAFRDSRSFFGSITANNRVPQGFPVR